MDVYIYDAVRTPRGKGSAKKGSLRDIKPVHLLSLLYEAIEKRNGLNPKEIEEVVLGCVGQFGDQGANIAKVSTLYHGWPNSLVGLTVGTFCTSALTAVADAAAKIHAGFNQLMLAGGVEMLSRVPMFADHGALFSDEEVVERASFTHMGVAADLIASLEGFEREELDEYAVLSHHRAAYATAQGYFQRSLIPVVNAEGELVLGHDECVRPNASMESMAALQPLFEPHVSPSIRQKIRQIYPQLPELRHFHHVGNSPAMADGACLLLLANRATGQRLGLKPRARIRSLAFSCVEPIIMLTGGQAAIEKAIAKAKLTPDDIDLFDFAEAFSASCLKFQRDLNVSLDRFNVNGGTMVMGHAQGASGAMIVTTLLEEMERRSLQFGAAGISGAVGLGAGIVIERL